MQETDEARIKGGNQERNILSIVNCPDQSEKFRTDEPPVGIGGCSFFFDLHKEITDLKPNPSGGKYNYKLDKNYTGIAKLMVFTEHALSKGPVSFVGYLISEAERKAKLILTLETNSGNKQIELPGDNNGSIVTDIKFKETHDRVKKTIRPHRLNLPESVTAARVIGWKIIDSRNNALFSDSGNDNYYFYVTMYH